VVALTASLCAIVLATVVNSAGVHPIHTTLAELSYDASAAEVRISLRVFADDLAGAVSGWAARRPKVGASIDDATTAYVSGAFVLVARDGRQVPLAGCGSRSTGDVLWLCLRAPLAGGLAGVRLRDRLLTDHFEDQINIVQATYDGRRVSLLFTPGTGERRLP
jgi:hypothetical protein